jgi:hypothetical protein
MEHGKCDQQHEQAARQAKIVDGKAEDVEDCSAGDSRDDAADRRSD